ncbi:carbonic anhydrase [Pengzhenrongella sp.]|jgi:carbonic anhydrase|uniref:carbonic anhydrase n=1 Tax=Pengzhenrongella sp. TaxID=2888820 RepID=UPI002F95AD8F
MPNQMTPAQAWAVLREGNARFVSGEMEHPSQSVERRTEVSVEQTPLAVLFGCSDSRVAAEIIFDQGLGDLFVVRTAGHVLDTTVVGSIEYGVDLLHTPLVVVLAHDGCGAVAAAMTALTTGELPRGFVRAIVDRVIPSIVGLGEGGVGSLLSLDAAALGREHARHTVQMLQDYSAGLSEAISEGRCAIVGLEYTLADGRVSLVESVGDIGQFGDPVD